jgi:hypothetical protein
LRNARDELTGVTLIALDVDAMIRHVVDKSQPESGLMPLPVHSNQIPFQQVV